MLRANPGPMHGVKWRSWPLMVAPEGFLERPGPTGGRVRGVVAPEG